ncbi:MAG: hypothetical protein ACE5E5_08490 [Phycisphaerae bacterium]
MPDQRTKRKVKAAAPSVRLCPTPASFSSASKGRIPPDFNSVSRLAAIETATYWLNNLSTEDVIALIPVLVKHAEY